MRRTTFKFLFICILILGAHRAGAQVSVVFYPSPAKQFFIDDIWKTTLINTSTAIVNVNVQCAIRTGGSLNVLTVTTQVMTLTPGANHFSAIESGSAKWVYGSTEQSTVLQSTGKLPYGQYVLCITIYAASTNKMLGSNCNEMEVAPMLPPELASPRNQEEISVQYPVLAWIPPRPLIGLNIIYSLHLVALQKDQNPAEGILQNVPILNLNDLTSTYTTYQVTAQTLNPDVTYAWQVGASYEDYNLGTTDIWTFTVKPSPPPPTDDVIYPVATKISDGHFYITKGIFRFVYNNKANDKKLKYVIMRMGKREALKALPEIEIKPGVNELQIDARHNTGMKEKQYYDLEITDSKGQVYKLLYIYITE
jgi:hypothetical protein